MKSLSGLPEQSSVVSGDLLDVLDVLGDVLLYLPHSKRQILLEIRCSKSWDVLI